MWPFASQNTKPVCENAFLRTNQNLNVLNSPVLVAWRVFIEWQQIKFRKAQIERPQ